MNTMVSVIVPCYNMADKISRLLESLLKQTYSKLEIIFVNDGSKDNTENVILEYKQRFVDKGYEIIIVNQKNQGLGAAINTGLSKVRGEYFCWPDADDYLEPDSIEIRVNAMEQHPEVAVVSSDAFLRKEKSVDIVRGKLSELYPKSAEKNQFYLLLNEESFFCPGCHMVRTEMFLEVNPKRCIYPARRGQNWQLLLPLYYKYPRLYIDIPLYNYIDYSDSMSKNKKDLNNLLERYEEHYEILKATLKMIEKNQNANLHDELQTVELRTCRNIFEAAFKYGDYYLMKNTFSKLQELNSIKFKDILKYFIGKKAYLRMVFKNIRRGK